MIMNATQRGYQVVLLLILSAFSSTHTVAQPVEALQERTAVLEKKLFGDLAFREKMAYLSDEDYVHFLQLLDRDSLMEANLFDMRKRLESGQAVDVPYSEFNEETRQVDYDTISFTSLAWFNHHFDSLAHVHKEDIDKQAQVDTARMSPTDRIAQIARELTENQGFERFNYVMDSLLDIQEGRSPENNEADCLPAGTYRVRLSQPSLKKTSLQISLLSQEDSVSLTILPTGWQVGDPEWKTEKASTKQSEQSVAWQITGFYVGRLTMEGGHTDTTHLAFSGRIEKLPGCRTTGKAEKLAVSDSTPWISAPVFGH